MSTLRFGERIRKEGVLRPGASALIFDEAREGVLLTRREDNGRWCLPGGGMDPGESAAEACVREVLEEMGWGCGLPNWWASRGALLRRWLGLPVHGSLNKQLT